VSFSLLTTPGRLLDFCRFFIDRQPVPLLSNLRVPLIPFHREDRLYWIRRQSLRILPNTQVTYSRLYLTNYSALIRFFRLFPLYLRHPHLYRYDEIGPPTATIRYLPSFSNLSVFMQLKVVGCILADVVSLRNPSAVLIRQHEVTAVVAKPYDGCSIQVFASVVYQGSNAEPLSLLQSNTLCAKANRYYLGSHIGTSSG
jgi:hypothetical protein